MRWLIVLMMASCAAAAKDDKRLTCTGFSDSLIEKINAQINLELHASYLYHAYSRYFDRDDVALPGFQKFFEDMSKEEREHADKLLAYMNKRGCRFELRDIKICEFTTSASGTFDSMGCYGKNDRWFNGKYSMENALAIEKFVNDELLRLHSASDDPHFGHFMEHHYLDEQVESIKELADNVRKLHRVGEGLGEYIFDKELQG